MGLLLKFVKRDWVITFKLAILLGWLGFFLIGWGTLKWSPEAMLRFVLFAPIFMLTGLFISFATFYWIFRHIGTSIKRMDFF